VSHPKKPAKPPGGLKPLYGPLPRARYSMPPADVLAAHETRRALAHALFAAWLRSLGSEV
jgi:hypothetical protein